MPKKTTILILSFLVLSVSSCKMWPVSVGIYNQSDEMVEVKLTVSKNDKNATEALPLLIGRFDSKYDQLSFRNLSPLKIDSTAHEFQTLYLLKPGESLKIATYWDDEYRGYEYYSTAGKGKNDHKNQFRQISIAHPNLNISSAPKNLDGLIKPLNEEKKVWGIVVF